MTRSDFGAVAKVLAQNKPHPKHGTIGERRLWTTLVNTFARTFSGRPAFDSDDFRTSAGMTASDHGDLDD
jgi:hypothetical protein